MEAVFHCTIPGGMPWDTESTKCVTQRHPRSNSSAPLPGAGDLKLASVTDGLFSDSKMKLNELIHFWYFYGLFWKNQPKF